MSKRLIALGLLTLAFGAVRTAASGGRGEQLDGIGKAQSPNRRGI
jgi:hypothetical protein